MATEITADTPLTFELIQAADGHQMSLWMKTRRAEVDAILQAKSEEIANRVMDQNSRLSAAEEARAQRQVELTEQQEKARIDREVEMERRRKLTPEERLAEDRAARELAAEEERLATEERIAEEKDKAYLSTLRPTEREAEIKRREDEAIAKQKAEEDALAAEQQKREEEAAAQLVADETAKEAVEKDRLEKESAEKVAIEKAAELEKQQLAEKQRIAAEEAARPKQKIVVNYQATDDDGNPIGRPTHLEADTWEEMSKKQQEAHVNAVRYAERMKKQAARKPIPAKPEPVIAILTDEEREAVQKEAEAGEGTKAEIAKLKLAQDDANKERAEARRQAEWNRQNNESITFVRAHKNDFYPCQANADILAEYIKSEKLEWNATNLEIAFTALSTKLAQRPEEETTQVPSNSAPVEQPINPQPPVIPVTVPVASEIPPTPPAANPPAESVSVVAPTPTQEVAQTAPIPSETPAPPAVNPPAPVKRPASGIEPGSLHGGRRVTVTPESAQKSVSEIKREIARMPVDVYKKRLRDPKFREILKSAGISV